MPDSAESAEMPALESPATDEHSAQRRGSKLTSEGDIWNWCSSATTVGEISCKHVEERVYTFRTSTGRRAVPTPESRFPAKWHLAPTSVLRVFGFIASESPAADRITESLGKLFRNVANSASFETKIERQYDLLARRFRIENAHSIRSFLPNDELVEALLGAASLIPSVLLDTTETPILKSVSHSDEERDRELQILVPTKVSVRAAQESLEVFDAQWWMILPSSVRRLVTLDVQFK